MKLGFAFVLAVSFVGCETDPVATTSVGRFAGRRREGVLEFLGVRYGAAPVGALRFRPPVPAGYASGVQPAKAFAPAPPQLPDIEEQASTAPQSEDCLFLNVFTPSLSGHRPVMVFVHGGGWTNGGTVDPWYDGAHLAQRGDIVVVTVGYRLGPLGFLDLSALGGPDYAGSGNLGILDQRLALRWVREHVADFGGDPDQITICGESAGAQSVAVHLALPESRALFRRVIAESGALSLLHSQASARATTEQFVKFAAVSDVAGLLALSEAQILDAEQKLIQSTSFSDLLFGPVIDGVVVTEPPLHAIARGDAAGVPLLTGTTHDETKYWYFYDEWLAGVAPRDGAKLLPFVSDLFDEPALEALIEGYEARSPTASPGDITMQLATDALFRQPQIRLAEAHAAHEPQTYMYLFDWRTPIENGLYGSPHAVELPFVFRTFDTPSVDDFVGKSPPIRLADAVEDAWIAFVRGQAPSSPLLQDWPAYDASRRATMHLNVASTVEDDPLGADRQAWQAIAFDSVSPAI